VKTPNVIVKDSKGRVLIKNTDYTVVYPSGRKNKGKYKVLVKFKGNYTGEVSREFEIKAMPKPQKPKSTLITKLTAKKKGFVVKWRKITKDNTGYQLQYSTSRSFSKKTTKTITIGKTKTVSKTVSKLKAKKNHYVRVRCYYKVKYNNKERTLYSSWTQTKKVKTKK